MSEPLFEIALRRERIRARIEKERQELRHALAPFAPVVGLVGCGLALGRSLRAHPQWLIGGAVVFLVWRPRSALKWARRGWGVWQVWRQWREWAARS